MSNLKRYPDYKDSDVPWLGKIPSHWKAIAIKHISRVHRGASPRPIADPKYFDDEGEYAWVRIADVTASDQYLLKTTQRLSELGSSLSVKMQPEDIFLSIAGSVGKPIITKVKACIHDGFVYFPDWDQSTRFLYYIFASGQPYLGLGKLGTQLNLNTDTVGHIKIGLPPINEQKLVVSFLDKKLSHIDTLISKQKQLLEKLAEQRSAVITHAVTKGLNPDVPMKNSGVEWLGDTPEHWDDWKITHAINSIGSGTTPKSTDLSYYEGEIPWVTTSELRETIIKDTQKKLTEGAISDYSALKVYPKNSVAIAMYGATIGRLGILGTEATFNQACCVFEESEKLHYKFLYYWLWYRRPILISLSNGGGQPNLNQDDFRKIVMSLPPLDEQIEISTYLDKETKKIDQLSKSINTIIGKLNEYRSALITQAVTGKIDVRDTDNQTVEGVA